jgi:hypothetical protein
MIKPMDNRFFSRTAEHDETAPLARLMIFIPTRWAFSQKRFQRSA